MINTGLLLRKPGESAYARLLRFLIANQSIDYIKIKEEFRKANIEEEYLNDDRNSWSEGWLSKSVSKYESNYLNSNLISKQSLYSILPKRYRPKKACNTCIIMGYHSVIFDFPWITTCPIHNENLTKRCKLCSNPWSTPHQLTKNKCIQCGPYKNIGDLFVDNQINIRELKSIHRFLEDFEKGKSKFTQNFHFKNPYKINNSKNINNTLSPFFHSVIKLSPETYHLNNPAFTYKTQCKTYRVKEIVEKQIKELYYTNDKVDHTELAIETISVNKIFNLLNKILTKESYCKGCCEVYKFPKKSCLCCSTLSAWKQIINRYNFHPIKQDSCVGLDSFIVNIDINKLYQNTNKPSAPELYNYLVLKNNNDVNIHLSLPKELSILIYENNLWTLAIHVYQLVKFTMSFYKRPGNGFCIIDLWSELTNIMKAENSQFCPYFIRYNNKSLEINYPSLVCNESLEMDDHLSALLKS